MRLNYVSVTKRHKFKRSDERCVVRAELDCIPPILWFKQLQLFWICSPNLRKLCLEPKLHNNVIILYLRNQNYIIEAIEVLKRLIEKANTSYIIQDHLAFSSNLKELIL